MLPNNRTPSASVIQCRRKERLSNSLKTIENCFLSCSCSNSFWVERGRTRSQVPFCCGRPKSELPRQVRTQHDPEIHRRRAATIHGFSRNSGVTFLNGKEASNKQAKFCEVLGPSFCRECTREGSRNENKEEIYELFWPKGGRSDFRTTTPLYDAIVHREYCPSSGDLDIESRQMFMRLHNFNKAPQYFINPSDGMGTSEKSERSESRASVISLDSVENLSIDSLSVKAENESTRFFRSLSETAASLRHLCSLNRSLSRSRGGSSDATEGNKSGQRRSSKSRGRAAGFSRLPVEPPLLTIEFANGIMNPANTTKEQMEAALYGTSTVNVPCGKTNQS